MTALTALFFLSGVAGLAYQVVWFRMLFRTFGVGVYAVTTVVAIFMGGLAIGSLVAGRITRRRSGSLLRWYATAEVGVAVAAIIATQVMDALPGLSSDIVRSTGLDGAGLLAFRIATSAVVLLPPTIIMGTTLPLLAGHLARQPQAVGRRVGALYGVNTLGAVTGVLFTGFVSIAVYGEQTTIWFAVALNTIVGLGSLLLASGAEGGSSTVDRSESPTLSPRVIKILVVAMVSGFCALSLEVIWSRMLTLLLGNSVYGFASMLGAYLTGIGIGSALMSKWVGRIKSPLLWFGAFEIANSILGLVSLHVFREIGMGQQDARYTYSLVWSLQDFVRLGLNATLIVLPVTLIYGAIFPLASRLVAAAGRTEEAVGKLYGLNTIGGIVGSFVVGLVLIPAVGTLLSFLLISLISLGVGLYLLAMSGHAKRRTIGLVSTLAMVGLMAFSFEDPFLAVLTDRTAKSGLEVVAHEEDRGVTVTVLENEKKAHFLYINGLYVSNTFPGVGEMMFNLPLAFHPKDGPMKVLAIGLGVGELLRYGVDIGHDLTVVELHRAVVRLFEDLNPDGKSYLENANVRIVQGDGRNFLLHTDEKFDLILVDGSPPVYASGMVNLYSLEFSRLAKSHLKKDGILTIWFPVICFERDLWSVLRNFSETYESIGMFSQPRTSNAMMMGSDRPNAFTLPFDEFAKSYNRRRLSRRNRPAGFLSGFKIREEELRRRAAEFPIVTDDHPYTEYPLQPFLRGEEYYPDNRFLFRSRTSTTAGH